MDPSFLLYVLIFLILLAFSAFFSGSETAYFSLTQSTINRLGRSKKTAARQVTFLLKEPRILLITIIIGNTIVNVTTASLAAVLTTAYSRNAELPETLILLLNVVVVTLVILFFSEIIPKVIAIKSRQKFALRASLILTFFYYLFYPLTIMFHSVSNLFSSALGADKDKYNLSEQELRTLVEIGEERGALHKDEKEMIHSIFEMSDTTAREIMIPRTDMICVERTASLTQVLNIIKDKIHSRIPVYSETVDNITGILYVKDLLPFIKRKPVNGINLDTLVHPAYYVPEQKKINELLREFQLEKIHMAIVVDEYGGTAGLVTLEDVIEEIVGEIQDEFDIDAPLFEKVAEGSYVVNGIMPLEEINDEMHIDLPTEEGVETLAGFLLGQFGSVPKLKEKIVFNGNEFTIEKVTKKRIQQVRISRLKQN